MAPGSGDSVTRLYSRLARIRVAGADPQLQFIHMDDLVEALELCLLETVPGTFNITGEGTVAFSELARVAGRRPAGRAGAAPRVPGARGLVAAPAGRGARERPRDGAMAVGGQQREAGARDRVPSAVHLAGDAHEFGAGRRWRDAARVNAETLRAGAPARRPLPSLVRVRFPGTATGVGEHALSRRC